MSRHIFWLSDGQSNEQGSPPGTTEGGADFAAGTKANNASVLWAASDNFGENTSKVQLGMVLWGDTIGGSGLRMPHHGPEQQIAARAVAAGWATAPRSFTYAKWTHNGTPIAKFGPGGFAGNSSTPGVDYFRLRRVITLACPSVTNFDWVYSAGQGESDCDVADGSLAQANALGANRLALYLIVAAIVGKPAKVAIIQQIPSGVWGSSQSTTGPWVSNGRASLQALHNTTASDGCPFKVCNVDDLDLYAEDHLHLKSASQHTSGDRRFDIASQYIS